LNDHLHGKSAKRDHPDEHAGRNGHLEWRDGQLLERHLHVERRELLGYLCAVGQWKQTITANFTAHSDQSSSTGSFKLKVKK
jgi:hypothetical protein